MEGEENYVAQKKLVLKSLLFLLSVEVVNSYFLDLNVIVFILRTVQLVGLSG